MLSGLGILPRGLKMQASLRAIALASLLVSVSPWASAQVVHGSVELTVTDPTGAVIPAATVQVEHLSTGLKREVQSDEAGLARLTALPSGIYSVEVRCDGFGTLETNVEVKPGATLQETVVLEIGSISEVITVEAGAPRLQTSRGSIVFRSRGKAKSRSFPPRNYSVFVPAPNRESYNAVDESGFQRVETKPLSTFASDVDTASYSNVRRFLQAGQLPPKEAVRIEELLNYFRYDDPAPEGEHPVAIATEVTRCPWQPGNKLARIALRTKPIAAGELPPANLTFLIDVSGSMGSADKLPLLQQAFLMLVDQLRPQDTVSIVVYAGAAGVALEPTRGSSKGRIRQAIRRLHAEGSTAGAAGIHHAYQLARESFKTKGANRVILATDGDFNVGVSSEAELIRLIEKKRESGIFLTVMGFGTGNLQDAKMEQLADHGNGQYLYIDSPLEARRALVEQIGGTLVTVAKDVKIQVEFNPAHVRRYRLIGCENRLLRDEDFKNDRKDAGDLGAGHSVVALYEVEPERGQSDASDSLRYQQPQPTPQAQGSGELLHVKVRYKPPAEDVSRQLDVPVRDADTPVEESSENLRWAAAVAQFGMLLRGSEHLGNASWKHAAALARGAMGVDANGDRAEFVYLVKTASKLDGKATTSGLR